MNHVTKASHDGSGAAQPYTNVSEADLDDCRRQGSNGGSGGNGGDGGSSGTGDGRGGKKQGGLVGDAWASGLESVWNQAKMYTGAPTWAPTPRPLLPPLRAAL